MVIDWKISTKEYFKEKPEDILWYKLYRNDKFLVYKNKRKYFDDFLDIHEIPICLRLYKFFYKIGNIYINMKEVNGCIVKPYREEKDNKLYHLVIKFNNNPKIYVDLIDYSRENVINEQHRINVYLNKIKQGLI